MILAWRLCFLMALIDIALHGLIKPWVHHLVPFGVNLARSQLWQPAFPIAITHVVRTDVDGMTRASRNAVRCALRFDFWSLYKI